MDAPAAAIAAFDLSFGKCELAHHQLANCQSLASDVGGRM
jgi:hypothetical protein